jgi:photosystem II stability/assembly factor-like uncharacterized protein
MLKWVCLTSCRCLATALLGVVAPSIHAQIAFPALDRPALTVRAPERQFMLAAAKAGSRLVAVGERGLIALSDNAGETWRQAGRVPVSISLTAVSFATDKLGWAVGHGGVILNTSDAGETWVLQANGTQLAKAALAAAETMVSSNPSDPNGERLMKSAHQLVSDGADKPLLDVHFQDASRGWVVGAYNLFFETRDGGQTWTSLRHLIDNPKEMHLYAIRSAGADVYVIGEQGQMHRSLDSGRSFQALKSPYAGSWFTLAVASDGAVIAGGLRGNLFRSTNRGDSWEQIVGAGPVSFVSASALAGKDVMVANQAGQVFTLGPDLKLTPFYKSPTYPLTGVVPLGSGGILVMAATGVTHVSAAQLKKGN